MSRKM